ncbi:MAG: hypothetical protein JW717_03055 [Marinilabiliaceae bacterium]|nr:hypothetical protein [Marinilabiliaceae bacterium]
MKGLLVFISILFLLASCTSDYELEESIFVADSEFPELPEYSEWGYNTFGAFYDRKHFVSNNSEVPVKVILTNVKFKS